jgi:hypothetical protein
MFAAGINFHCAGWALFLFHYFKIAVLDQRSKLKIAIFFILSNFFYVERPPLKPPVLSRARGLSEAKGEGSRDAQEPTRCSKHSKQWRNCSFLDDLLRML